ncbi:MAG TPA: hypothetical protein VGM17_02365 [Rhizomicrobium sp.]|jgi:hypothetical protein
MKSAKKETPAEAAERIANRMKDIRRRAATAVANGTVGNAVFDLAARGEAPTVDAIIRLLLSDEPLTRDNGKEAREIAAQLLDEAASKQRVPEF